MIWVSACSSPKQQEENQVEEFDQAADQLQEQLEGMLVNIPPPSEIPYLIQSTGASFDKSLLNDISKVDQYHSEDDKSAMNLGVYATDIGYLSSYDQSQDALTFFDQIKSLADQIGVTSSIDNEMVEDFENSLGSKEELGQILDEAIGDTQMHLEESGRDRTAALVATGTFAEGLHIACSLIGQFPKGAVAEDDANSSFIALAIPLVKLVLDQKKPLTELNAMLKSLDSDATTDQLVKLTTELVNEYESLNIEATFENNQAVTYLEEGKLDGLIQKVSNLRQYITG
ncbi:MAG: hypothetical protein DHS20C17_12290 [Cyclobacteriaceae bacterium]|nr:MAG: hypothetical protein DHS20C17_12290 [Cyclobacteriaceae bacterium]